MHNPGSWANRCCFCMSSWLHVWVAEVWGSTHPSHFTYGRCCASIDAILSTGALLQPCLQWNMMLILTSSYYDEELNPMHQCLRPWSEPTRALQSSLIKSLLKITVAISTILCNSIISDWVVWQSYAPSWISRKTPTNNPSSNGPTRRWLRKRRPFLV